MFKDGYGGRDGIVVPPTSIGKISSSDGTTHTFLVGELGHQLTNFADEGSGSQGAWTAWYINYPMAYSTASTNGVFNARELSDPYDFTSWEVFRGPHPGGVNFVFCDGSVKLIGTHTNSVILDRLANRMDGEVVGEY